MWLNIDYYIENTEKKRKELMEMIDVENSQESEFIKWQEEYGKIKEKNGIKIGEKNIIKNLLKSMKPHEIATKTGIPITEINKIAKQ